MYFTVWTPANEARVCYPLCDSYTYFVSLQVSHKCKLKQSLQMIICIVIPNVWEITLDKSESLPYMETTQCASVLIENNKQNAQQPNLFEAQLGCRLEIVFLLKILSSLLQALENVCFQ